jgi:hypothetical protein
MGGPSFARPVGAAADVKELEYISALHQTGDSVRLDGSIKGTLGLGRLLHSRFRSNMRREQQMISPLVCLPFFLGSIL